MISCGGRSSAYGGKIGLVGREGLVVEGDAYLMHVLMEGRIPTPRARHFAHSVDTGGDGDWMLRCCWWTDGYVQNSHSLLSFIWANSPTKNSFFAYPPASTHVCPFESLFASSSENIVDCHERTSSTSTKHKLSVREILSPKARSVMYLWRMAGVNPEKKGSKKK